ncbi:MAG TPA: phosphocholine cytidylyltransferase family protein [Gemmatimonadales bacterium]|nr:phosphocholine cytidylyltransferase family protein [Gemmatimonadales bacterium]
MQQAVILAAGTATRLRPLTDTTPKCLLEVGGRAILDWLLAGLAAAGIGRVILVTGYFADLVHAHLAGRRFPFELRLAENPEYATTNNAVSLLVARPYTRPGSLVICDGDVVIRPEPLARLIAEPAACALLVDREAPLAGEEMKVRLDPEGRVRHLSKELSPAEAQGESIGIQKVGGPALDQLWTALEGLVRSGRTGVFYEAAFQQLLDAGVPFHAVPIASQDWIEIDSREDLALARRRFATGEAGAR